MHQAKKYYEHSGAVGLMGPIYMIVLGAIGTLVLGAVYGYAIFYIPFIYLNFFITLGFGGLVGFCVGMGGKLGKVRNPILMLLFGFAFGLAAEYIGWVSWIYAFTEQGSLILAPSDMANALQVIAKDGAWSIFGWTPKDVELYMIWGVEAIMIIGTSTLVASGTVISIPFCERCNKWIEAEDSIEPLDPISNPDDLKSQLEQGEYGLLQSLNRKDDKTDAYTQVSLLHCPGCQQNHFLSIKSIVVSTGSDNKEKKNETKIIENLIIDPEQYRMIKAQW